LNSAKRSVLLAAVGGMMAASYLHSQGIVDLSYGFAEGGLLEGALMAITGAVAGYVVLLVFRKLRDLTAREKK
jgi:hypothetical protein